MASAAVLGRILYGRVLVVAGGALQPHVVLVDLVAPVVLARLVVVTGDAELLGIALGMVLDESLVELLAVAVVAGRRLFRRIHRDVVALRALQPQLLVPSVLEDDGPAAVRQSHPLRDAGGIVRHEVAKDADSAQQAGSDSRGQKPFVQHENPPRHAVLRFSAQRYILL